MPGSAAPSTQGRRRPIRVLVRSERYPARGSDTASQILESPKISPIAPGAMSSTSVENFIR